MHCVSNTAHLCNILQYISQYLNEILQYIAISFSLAIPTPSTCMSILIFDSLQDTGRIGYRVENAEYIHVIQNRIEKRITQLS